VLEDGFLAAARGQTRETVLRACRFMESYPNDPFERTKHEVLEAMGEAPSGDVARGAEPGGDGPPTDDDLQRWWGLVTDAQHVEMERELALRGEREVVRGLRSLAERSGRVGASFSRGKIEGFNGQS
jgi:hypothetical protein